MATSKSKAAAATSPPRSLLAQSCRFLGTTAGLDLTLRFFHGLVIISANAAAHDESVASRSFIAASQLNLDCVQNVLDTISKEYASLAYKTLDLLEWSCLLLYFALENLTMFHDMQIHVVPWYTPVLVEANKFWFYAIFASIIRNITLRIGLFNSPRTFPFSKRKRQLSSPSPPPPPPWRRLVVDALDLTLPASFVGWLVLDDVTIGCLMTLSTILVWRDVWGKAQQ